MPEHDAYVSLFFAGTLKQYGVKLHQLVAGRPGLRVELVNLPNSW